MSNISKPITPFISSESSLPEITIKATILAIILAIVLAAANTYLGLKVGITVTGSIPAAIISMSILRLFKQSNILENNIVQTAASAGDALASGVIFTIPALLIVQFWSDFNFLSTIIIISTGGILGVMFSVPLRRTFIYNNNLSFPEGVAIGNVLKSSSQGGNIRKLMQGSIIGVLVSFSQNGLKIMSDSISIWVREKNTLFGISLGFDVAVLAAGYIVGPVVAFSILIGAIIGPVLGTSIFSLSETMPLGAQNASIAASIWKEHIRYVGVGTMLFGGIWAIFSLVQPIINGIKTSIDSLQTRKNKGHNAIPRVEKDIPFNVVLWSLLFLLIIAGGIFITYLNHSSLILSETEKVLVTVLQVIYLITAGFLFSAICCYLSGLVGSSSNPLSGLILSSVIGIAFLLLPVFAKGNNLSELHNLKSAAAMVIIVATIIGTASAIAQDNLQDLKAGQIVGSTPWKQQIMLIIGVIAAALVIPPVLQLLLEAYGIGGIMPRPGMNPSNMLFAPQANLIASISMGVFSQNLPWYEISIGFFIAIASIIINRLIQPYGYKLPVLAVGMGVYLPMSASTPIIIGGIISYLVNKRILNGKKDNKQEGVSISCGLIAGGSITGILIAIPVAILKVPEPLRIVPESFNEYSGFVSMIIILMLSFWMLRSSTK